jgi:hypothetical protein
LGHNEDTALGDVQSLLEVVVNRIEDHEASYLCNTLGPRGELALLPGSNTVVSRDPK